MNKSLLISAIGVSFGLIAPSTKASLYINDFDDTTGIILSDSNGSSSLASVPAPGGKSGNALHLANSDTSSDYAELVHGLTLARASDDYTVLFRVYIPSGADQNTFKGIYNYGPGEGIRRRTDEGTFGNSNGTDLGVTWAFDTWYTVAMVLVQSSTGQDVYVATGVNAQPTAGDFIGTSGSGSSGDFLSTVFFDSGGDLYIDDYTINQGVDFTIAAVPEPAAGCALLGGIALLFWRKRSAA